MSPPRKLSDKQAAMVLSDQRSARALAKLIGVCPHTIDRIRRREIYKNVADQSEAQTDHTT